MQDNYTTKAKHLTIDSRRLIERWKKEGKSNREIASLLGKAPQTIHTEIKRGTVRQCLGKVPQTIHTEIKRDQGTKGKDSPLS
ncbi:transposase-like protein, IS1239 [Streptococcus pneumoniae]|nr:transposase-like protein, IS1239 [Streptococcus pneumoniae]